MIIECTRRDTVALTPEDQAIWGHLSRRHAALLSRSRQADARDAAWIFCWVDDVVAGVHLENHTENPAYR